MFNRIFYLLKREIEIAIKTIDILLLYDGMLNKTEIETALRNFVDKLSLSFSLKKNINLHFTYFIPNN